jgi:monovalent cation/hydrogen antiporter
VGNAEFLIAGLLVAIVALSALARYLAVPYPIILVIGGAVLGFVPGLPEVELDPDVVLVIFLPPLLYGVSIYANFTDLRAATRGLALNTVALVLATMCAVALIAHELIDGMSWEAAFVLGAIVSPTDPIAATAVMRRLDAPRRLVSSIEGEGLFNDATALVAYKIAVAAVVAGSFSLSEAGLEFVFGAAAGVAIGLVVGRLVAEVRRRTPDDQLNVTLSLFTGYAAFIPADAIGASGVLATVTAGLYMGILGPKILPTGTRLQGYFVWNILDFIVNAVLFVLIGLQLRTIVDGLSGYSVGDLATYAIAVSLAVTGVRLVWFFSIPYLIRLLDRRPSQRSRRVGASQRLVVAWSGMRGAVSLAVALALPLSIDAGGEFPQRDLIIFLTFAVIFFTLVVQGLSLPSLLRRLGVTGGGEETDEELRGRLVAAKAALRQIDELAEEPWTRDDTIDRLRRFYEYRKRRFAAQAGKIEDEGYEDRTAAYQQTLQLVLAAQRDALLRMRGDGELSNEAMNRILRELDLEEARLEV